MRGWQVLVWLFGNRRNKKWSSIILLLELHTRSCHMWWGWSWVRWWIIPRRESRWNQSWAASTCLEKEYDPKNTIATARHRGGNIMLFAKGRGWLNCIEGLTDGPIYHKIWDENLLSSARTLFFLEDSSTTHLNHPKSTTKTTKAKEEVHLGHGVDLEI